MSLLGVLKDTTSGVLTTVNSAVGGTLNTVNSAAGGTLSTVNDAVGGTLNTTGSVVDGTVDTVKNVAGDTLDTASNVVGDTLSTTNDVVGGTLDTVKNVVASTVDTVNTAVSGTLSGDPNVIGNTLNGVGKVVDSTLSDVSNVLNSTVSGVTNIVDDTLNGVSKVVDSTVDGVSKVVDNTVDGVAKVVDSTVNGVAKVVDNTVDGVAKVVDGTVNGVTKVVDTVATPVVAPLPFPTLPISIPITIAPAPALVPAQTTGLPVTTPVTTPKATASPPTVTVEPITPTGTPAPGITETVAPPSHSPSPSSTHDGSQATTTKPFITSVPSKSNYTVQAQSVESTPVFTTGSGGGPAQHVSLTSAATGDDQSNNSPSGGNSNSGPATVKVTTLVGVSFGMMTVIVAVLAIVMYVRQKRNATQSKYKKDKFSPSMLESHGSDCETSWSSAMYTQGNLTVTASRSFSTPWDDEELLVVRVPFETVKRGELISSGGFGEVFRGTYHSQDVAIKTLLPSKRKNISQIKIFQNEIKMMSALEHPRIVRFVAVAWESLAELCVITEYMAGGDLTSLLASFEACARPHGFDPEKVKIALHVSHALMYLHTLETPVLHRDLKSKNILLDAEWNAKVTDFGVSRERADETMTSGIGSTLWMAPEVMLGERYDEKADIYSFGVVLSELDTQQLPYAQVRDDETGRFVTQTTLLQLISAGKVTISLTESTSYTEIQQLARECVSLNPSERPTATEALHRLHLAASESGLDF